MEIVTLRLDSLPAERFDTWRATTRGRLIRLRQDSGLRPGSDAEEQVDAIFEQVLTPGAIAAESTILAILVDDVEIGTLWLSLPGERAFVIDVHTDRELSRQERDALAEQIEELARRTGARTLSVGIFHQEAATHRLFAGRGYDVSSIQMVLDPLPERTEQDERVRVSPMTADRFERFVRESEQTFAEELAATGRMSADDAIAEAHRQFAKELPDGLATDGQELFTAEAAGAEVGILWLSLRSRGAEPHGFILDIAVDAAHRRRGYGRAIMQAAEQETRRLGAASLGLHVFGSNAAAVALYERLGYRRLEELFVRVL